jgi:hypothetical protein
VIRGKFLKVIEDMFPAIGRYRFKLFFGFVREAYGQSPLRRQPHRTDGIVRFVYPSSKPHMEQWPS